MIHFKDGDIFATDVDAYAHGANCYGVMGAGIAVEFKNRWPKMYEDYHKCCQPKNTDCRDDRRYFIPGEAWVYGSENNDKKYCINLGTQVSHWSGAELRHIQCSLAQMVREALRYGIKSIALPAIGAGLGGLDWKDIKPMIEDLHTGGIDIYVAENYIKGVSLK